MTGVDFLASTKAIHRGSGSGHQPDAGGRGEQEFRAAPCPAWDRTMAD